MEILFILTGQKDILPDLMSYSEFLMRFVMPFCSVTNDVDKPQTRASAELISVTINMYV
jgi:hypothetical protein